MTTLQATYPLLDWHEFINWNLKHAIPIYENDTINVAELENVNKLKELLEATPKRTIANYIGMRLALFSSDLLNDDLRTQQQQYHREKSGVLKSDPRIMKCAKKTAELYVLPALPFRNTKIVKMLCIISVYLYQRQPSTFANTLMKNQKSGPSQ